MSKITFITLNQSSYNHLDHIDPQALYFIKDKAKLMLQGKQYGGSFEIVEHDPVVPMVGVLYINTSDMSSKIWNGRFYEGVSKGYTNIVDENATEEDALLPTSKAVSDYVKDKVRNATTNITDEVTNNLETYIDNRHFVTNAVNNLENYYTKLETYTKDEVDELISTFSSLSIRIVDVLPSDPLPSIIYFLSKTGSANDSYDEYIYINNRWEKIGSTDISLTDYYTKEDTDDLLDDKQDKLIAGNRITITDDNTISSKDEIYIGSGEMPDGYVVKIDTEGESTEIYSQEEVDELLDDKQDKLIAGHRITIEDDNTINSKDEIYVGSGDMPEGYVVKIDTEGESTEIYTKEEVDERIVTLEEIETPEILSIFNSIFN